MKVVVTALVAELVRGHGGRRHPRVEFLLAGVAELVMRLQRRVRNGAEVVKVARAKARQVVVAVIVVEATAPQPLFARRKSKLRCT
ncbi:hypothetical protein D3C77_583740 [compost metagenome]